MARDKTKTQRLYDFVAPAYAYFRHRTQHRDDTTAPLILQEVAPQDGELILDAGMGPGTYTMQIAKRNPAVKVVGVDLSPKFVEIAARRAAREGVQNVEFHVGDLEDLQFPEGTFHKLVCAGAISAVPDRAKAASELHRVLKDGGKAVVSEPHRTRSRKDRVWLAMMLGLGYVIPRLRGLQANDWNDYYLDHEDFQQLFGEAGFSQVTLEEPGGDICAICHK